MKGLSHSLQTRVDSIRIRVESLSSLRELVALPREYDVTRRQWSVLESQLSTAEARLLSRLKRGAGKFLRHVHETHAARSLNVLLGEVELDMSKAFTFFDTYMDVLTQRNTPELGPMLAGCDVLAWDGLKRDHPALAIVEPPLVYCDRGFGASILREEVLLPDGTPNPMPLIQIPYSKLKEKHNLTSVLHEVGHQAMVRLGLVTAIPKAFVAALKQAGAPDGIRELFSLWSSEIGPDFWTFCASGIAQAAGIKEILALPPNYVFRVSWTDPHPSPYLRVLLAFEWCRQVWGRGDWDRWEKEWLELYPLNEVPTETRRTVRKARRYLPLVGRVLLDRRFRVLNGKTIADLFDLSGLAPLKLKRIAVGADSGILKLKGLSPSVQLAVFRTVRERGNLREEAMDRIMTKWLLELGERRNHSHRQ
jgi:hypothetical protein